MNTAFMLMAQYDGRAIISLEDVRRDYFSHLTIENFRRKVSNGSITLVVTPLEGSQKAARGVHISDRAPCIEAQRHKVLTEHQKKHR